MNIGRGRKENRGGVAVVDFIRRAPSLLQILLHTLYSRCRCSTRIPSRRPSNHWMNHFTQRRSKRALLQRGEMHSL